MRQIRRANRARWQNLPFESGASFPGRRLSADALVTARTRMAGSSDLAPVPSRCVVNIFTTEQERAALYEAIGRAVASYSKLEHVAIELALVWDTSRETYGRSLAIAGKYALRHLGDDPALRTRVADALADASDLTATRNAIVHGVWSEFHLDDEGRFFAIRTLPEHATKGFDNPEHLFGKAMSTAQIRAFAERCECKMRELADVRDCINAEKRAASASEGSKP